MIQGPRRFPYHVARELKFDGAIGNLGANSLMLHDIAPTLTAHFGVIHGSIVAGATHAKAHRRHRHLVTRQQFAVGKRTCPFFTQQIRRRNFAIFQFNGCCCAVMPARQGVVRTTKCADGVLHFETSGVVRNQKG